MPQKNKSRLIPSDLSPQEKAELARMFLNPGLSENPQEPTLPIDPVLRQICLEALDVTASLPSEKVDNQNDLSPLDQVRKCTRKAKAMNRFSIKSALFVFAVFSLIGINGYNPAHASMKDNAIGVQANLGSNEDVTLDSAEAVFETLDNDKDHDSFVTVTVKRGNTIIVAGGPFGGHWNDHSDHTVALNVGRGWTRSQIGNRLRTELSFSTNGNDKWEFNYILRLTWSDGSTTEARYNGQVLTQDDRFRSYAVNL